MSFRAHKWIWTAGEGTELLSRMCWVVSYAGEHTRAGAGCFGGPPLMIKLVSIREGLPNLSLRVHNGF